MNKKVSTIFAMAALMGGAYCGNAFAADLDKYPVRNGDLEALSGKVLLQQNVNGENKILGFLKDGSNPSQAVLLGLNEKLSDSEVLNYAWNVLTTPKPSNDGNYYVLVNAATSDTLSFNNKGELLITGTPKKGEEGKVYATEKGVGMFNFDIKAVNKKFSSVNVKLVSDDDAEKALKFEEDAKTEEVTISVAEAGEGSLASTTFKSLAIAPVPAKDLNALFNERGFNFAAKPVLADVAVNGNIFAEQTVWAFTLDESAFDSKNTGKATDDNTGDLLGYYLTTEEANQKNLIVPAGTYFFTDVKFKNSKTFGSENIYASDIDWLNSTLVYLSASESEEGTDSDRANGGGFLLKSQKGTEFKYDLNTSDPQGNDTWITNACFTVETNFTANDSYPYSLTVKDFWYQPKKNAAGTDKQKNETVCMAVESYDNSRQSLVSKKLDGDPAAVFMLKASSVVDGKTLLHDTKKAAVYTIKFVSGNSYLNSKYLTVGKGVSGFQWEAKGAAIYDETFPIFQYTITAVSDNNEVTFTNRETGQNFTAQLFAVEGNENRYYMSIKDINGDASETNVITNTDFKVQPYTVENKTNTYAVEKTKNSEGVEVDAQPFAVNYVVELKSIEDVDSYAGFLKETEAVSRALAFARDVNDTSNKMYAIVDEDESNNKYLVGDDFTNDIYASAQWQLKKYSEVVISRVYVYNNTTTKSVDNVPEGDKVKAYTYTLQYIEDGEFYQDDAGYYRFLALDDNNGNGIALPKLGKAKLQKNADKFIIKENVDGSVSLIKYDNSDIFTGLKVANYNEYKGVEVKNIATDKKPDYRFDLTDEVYDTESEAREIKTYLEVQPVDISWPAHEGHVTIESELGNYINMNENRDAIVVDETDADTYYLYVTDTEKKNVVPSFYITKGIAAENGERMFMFNPTDSVDYYVAEGTYDKKYQWAEDATKVIFKAAKINDSRDTLTINVKGEDKYIAKKGDDDNKNIWGGLNRFKWQIIEATDAEGYYRIRQTGSDNEGNYLSALNDKMTWSGKDKAMLFTIESVAAPTANEGVSATEVKIIATDGAVNVKNAAGKNVVISTILGQIVANEVLTSDNATISVPAGIAIVSVDGEEAVKVSVR